jgi:dTDP-L-rhamnose 4-epimerase
MARTCMITGGAGFIGCAVSAVLARRFDHVIAVDNLHPQIHPQPVRPAALYERVELVVADITLEQTWAALLDATRPQVVVHLAAETGTGQSLTESSRHASVNVVGTTRMLDAFARCGVLPERIVLTSSRAVYGEGAWRNNATDKIYYPGQRSRAQLERGEWDFPDSTCLPFSAPSIEPHPTSVYGATKLAQEHILSAWALSFGVEAVILRLQNVYGPGQSLANPYTGIVSLFARLARAHQSIPIYEDGQIIRDFVFIDDVAAAIDRVVCNGAPSAGPYDIGSGRPTSILQLGAMIADFYKAPAPYISGAFRNGDVRHACCDITHTRMALNWTPVWALEEGLPALCQWIEEQFAANPQILSPPPADADAPTLRGVSS